MTNNNNQLQVSESTVALAQGFLTRDQVELLKRSLTTEGTNLTDDELGMFLYTAKQHNLNPLLRQIYVMKTGGRVSHIVSIDGLRSRAAATGNYNGQTEPAYKTSKTAMDPQKNPVGLISCTVGVYLKGVDHPVYATAYWDEYARYGNNGDLYFIWKKMPRLMLAKCAEALALRKAFPAELGGLYSEDEMNQAAPASEARPEDAKASAKQYGQMFALLKERGVTDRTDAMLFLHSFSGMQDMSADLKFGMATELIDQLKELTTEDVAGLLDSYKEGGPIEGEIVEDDKAEDQENAQG